MTKLREFKTKSNHMQNVMFDRHLFTTRQAKEWMKIHNLKPIKHVDKTINYLRYRLREPRAGAHYNTKSITRGIKSVMIY